MFSGTIEDNIKLGLPDATEKQIIEAAKVRIIIYQYILSIFNDHIRLQMHTTSFLNCKMVIKLKSEKKACN